MLIDKKNFTLYLFFLILSISFVMNVEAAVSLKVITPKDCQKISLENISVKGEVDPSEALKGNIYWETSIEGRNILLLQGQGRVGKVNEKF